MVLNHASLAPAGWHEVVEWLPDMATGVAALVRAAVVQKSLRMYRSEHEIRWSGNGSLFDAYQALRRQGARDQSAFLMGLATKAPLLGALGPDVTDRFLMCETTALPAEDGAPLVLCAVTDAIAVSMPAEAVWDRDRLPVTFHELLPDATLAGAEEEIDNLARSTHAHPIIERHRQRLRHDCSNPAELWRLRAQLFPQLTFGPDVENHLLSLNAGLLATLVNRLADLDNTAATWAVTGGDAPPWTTKVTPESPRTMNDPALREARRFRSVTGERVVFEWHARFGSGGRIHLRFDAGSREIEIGYIGGHLPLS